MEHRHERRVGLRRAWGAWDDRAAATHALFFGGSPPQNMIHIKFDPVQPGCAVLTRLTHLHRCGDSTTKDQHPDRLRRQMPARRPRAALMSTLGLALSLLLPGAAFAQEGPQKLPAITLTAGMHQIRAEVARTDLQRQIGLMHRSAMPAGEGMLFIFEQPGVQCFWMRNTLIPLSAAFLDDEGRIVNIEDMKPQTEDSHCSKKPVRFVLEMNQGWFAKKGLSAGSRIGGEPFRPAGAALK